MLETLDKAHDITKQRCRYKEATIKKKTVIEATKCWLQGGVTEDRGYVGVLGNV